jgi:CHAT domain-containing protein
MQARDQYEPYLIKARETVELLKAAELRDYFRDDCVDAARSRVTRLETVSQGAVIVYPILLSDRTELLVSLPAGLKRFVVPVGADTLTQEVRAFRQKLEKRTTREYLLHAQKLYDWLIRPLEPGLASTTIDNLVFMPDGPLRTIPMAALHDAKQFLISKYAVAITPGLDLTDPRSMKWDNIKVLAIGLTDSVQGFSSLPNVSAELQSIHEFYGRDLLLNQDFLVSRLEKELRDERFTIVHIASHGRRPATSFRKETCRNVAERDARVVPGKRATRVRSVDAERFCQQRIGPRTFRDVEFEGSAASLWSLILSGMGGPPRG